VSRWMRGLAAAGVAVGLGCAVLPASAAAVAGHSGRTGAARASTPQHGAVPTASGFGRLTPEITSMLRDVPGAGSAQRVAVEVQRAEIAMAVAAGQPGQAAQLVRAASTAGQAGSTGVITGSVLGTAGRPLAGACAAITGPHVMRVARTNVAGEFSVAGLAPGSYHVLYFGCAARGHFGSVEYAGASSGWAAAVSGTGLAAPAAAAVVVRAGGQVTLSPTRLSPATPSAAGPLARGWTGSATANAAAVASATAGDAAHSGGHITGKVTSRSGRGLRGICVTTGPRRGGHFYYTRTGSGGSYRTPLMKPGKYLMLFDNCLNPGNYAPQFYKNADFASARAITVTAGHVTAGISARLAPGAIIAGSIESAGPSPQPVAQACVQAGGLGKDSIYGGFAFSRVSGRYTIENLATGRYSVLVDPNCIAESIYAPASRKLSVTDGKTTPFTAKLAVGGTISGIVTAAWNNQPLPGVCVIAENVSTGYGNESETDSSGSYTITGLPGGQYQVAFGPCTATQNIVGQFYDNQTDPLNAAAVPVTLGGSATGIDAVMQQGGTVTGLVTNAAGHPLSNECVNLSSQNPFAFFGALTVHGRYTITGIPADQYEVDFGCGGSDRYSQQAYASPADPQAPALVAIATGAVTSGIDATLPLGGGVSGMVRTAAGAPVKDACVFAIGTKGKDLAVGDSEGFATTGKSGRYAMTGLAPGRYQVEFSSCSSQQYAPQWYRGQVSESRATLVRVAGGATTAGIDATVKAGGSISGIVRSGVTHRPVAGIGVIAIDEATGNEGVGFSGKGGSFVIEDLPPGKYLLTYIALHGMLAPTEGSHPVLVTVGRTARARVVTMSEGGAISGTVSSGSPAAGVAESCVLIQSASSSSVSAEGLTEADGSYEAKGLPAGNYVAYFGDPFCSLGGDGLAPQWYSGAQDRAGATPITVTAGIVTSAIDVTLQPDGTLSGTVTDQGSEPVVAICETLYPVSPDLAAGESFPIVAVSGTDGGYTVPNVVPGGYKVEFSTGCGATGYASQWYPNSPGPGGATTVPVAAGENVTAINAVLQP
jgi:hypothetical protein